MDLSPIEVSALITDASQVAPVYGCQYPDRGRCLYLSTEHLQFSTNLQTEIVLLVYQIKIGDCEIKACYFLLG